MAPSAGTWEWDWFDDSPRGPSYGVRRGDEVLCYTNRFKAGYDDAVAIAAAMNAAPDLPHSVRRANDGSGVYPRPADA